MIGRRGTSLILAVLIGTGLKAQTFTVSQTSNPPTAYGNVVSAEIGDTVFAQNGSTLTVQSGSGVRTNGTIRRLTVTIRCTNAAPNNCTSASRARLKIGNFSTSGRALPYTDFIALAGANTTLTGTTTGTNLDFVMGGWTSASTRTFTLDTKMPVAGNDADPAGTGTGARVNTYYIYVAKDPTDPTTGVTVGGTIHIRRGLKIQKLNDLRFGSMVKRTTGTGTVEVPSTADNVPRVTGGTSPPYLVEGVSSQASYGRASYRITAEPGTNISITYSPTGNVVMSNQSGGGGTLSITMLKTNTGTVNMPVSGELILGVGGRISVNSGSVQRGYYEGSFTVTVTYN